MPYRSILQCPPLQVQEEIVNKQFPPYPAHTDWDLISGIPEKYLTMSFTKNSSNYGIGKELL